MKNKRRIVFVTSIVVMTLAISLSSVVHPLPCIILAVAAYASALFSKIGKPYDSAAHFSAPPRKQYGEFLFGEISAETN